ncbi:MAG: cellulase family glycosylhydrolase [Anaerolineales bacterium]|nr:cellulase family glycosylhydrolase [Anaerolineales bacterium]
MEIRKPTPSVLMLILFMVSAVGCATSEATPDATSIPPIIASTTPIPRSNNTNVPTTTVTSVPTQPPPEHRIAVRVVDGNGEFYDRVTGDRFTPRGNNFIRVDQMESYSGGMMNYHSTFNVDYYDSQVVEDSLRNMHEQGYNTVRVFLNGNCKQNCIGDDAGRLSDAYIANVADFLDKAKTYGIYVLLTTDAEPANRYYISLLDTTWSEDFGGTNTSHLRGGGVLVGKEFWQDFIDALLAQDAPIEAILAYELRNELFFETNAAPLNHSSGVVSTANGKSYDMGSEEDKRRMLEENLVYWIDEIRAAILERDPTALVTIGFFVPQEPNPARQGDPRLVITTPAIWKSQADFIDLHLYPDPGLSMKQYVENFRIQDIQEKPIIMGEFGANKGIYASSVSAANALVNWQVESCKYGFDGWLLWTWDILNDPYFYSALGDGGKIGLALAPANRPDPCLVP